MRANALFMVALVATMWCNSSFADNDPAWRVSPISRYVGPYKDARRIILEALERRTDLTIAQRLALYDEEMKKQRDKFAAERRAEYESKSASVGKEHSCTSGSSGGKKDCGWKCARSPDSDLYTTKSWVQTGGTIKGLKVDSGKACIKETVAGKGRNKGSVTAAFRYRPDVIDASVLEDTIDLFNLITDDVEIELAPDNG